MSLMPFEAVKAALLDAAIPVAKTEPLEATRAALRTAVAQADLIVTGGGMSEGNDDHVTTAVKAEGSINVWKIAAKPGKPLAFGSVRSGERVAAFVGLPGNPVAVWCGLLTRVAVILLGAGLLGAPVSSDTARHGVALSGFAMLAWILSASLVISGKRRALRCW